MTTQDEVKKQLADVGVHSQLWGRGEVRELYRILLPGEAITQIVNGHYENGFALLCITNHRLLLIDKKPMFLSLEDVRFDMVSEIEYVAQLLEGTLIVRTPNRKLVFSSWNQRRLREVCRSLERQVMQLRQRFIQDQLTKHNKESRIEAEQAFEHTRQAAPPPRPYNEPGLFRFAATTVTVLSVGQAVAASLLLAHAFWNVQTLSVAFLQWLGLWCLALYWPAFVWLFSVQRGSQHRRHEQDQRIRTGR